MFPDPVGTTMRDGVGQDVIERLGSRDLNDDGEVCINDAAQLVDLVIKEYNKDCKKKYGSDSNVAIQKFSQFIAKVEYDKASPEILNFCFSFLKDLKNVSNNPKSAQKLIKIIEKSWFTD